MALTDAEWEALKKAGFPDGGRKPTFGDCMRHAGEKFWSTRTARGHVVTAVSPTHFQMVKEPAQGDPVYASPVQGAAAILIARAKAEALKGRDADREGVREYEDAERARR